MKATPILIIMITSMITPICMPMALPTITVMSISARSEVQGCGPGVTPSEDAAVVIHGGQEAWVVREALWPWEPPHTVMGGV